MKTALTAALLVLSISTMPAFGGPSISGGTSEAPWAASQDIFKQVLDYLNLKMRPVISIQFSETQRDEVLAQISCGNGTVATWTFTIESHCRATRIPGLCIPTRNVALDPAKSQSCEQGQQDRIDERN